MAGGLKLNQLQNIDTLKNTDLMLVDSTVGTGKITIKILRDHFNIDEMQKDVKNINDSFLNITNTLNKTIERVTALEKEDANLNSLINSLTSKVDVNTNNITILTRDKQNKTDEGLHTEDKTIVGAINSSAAKIDQLSNDKQNKSDEKLNTSDKTIVGSINEVKSKIPKIVNNLSEGGYDKALSAQQGIILSGQDKKLEGYIDGIVKNVKKFGAYGDGNTRTIKSVSSSITLEEVQKLLPEATLDDEYDWYILQSCISKYNKVLIPEGKYIISKPLLIIEDNKEVIFERKATLSIKEGSNISAIQIGKSTEAEHPRTANNCIIKNPTIEGLGVGTGIECRYCGINNLVDNPIISSVERGINFRVKDGFKYNIIRNVNIKNCTIGIDDTLAGFNSSTIEGGIIENNSKIGLISSSWGLNLVGTSIMSNNGTEIKLMGTNCQINIVNCKVHHNNESEADNDTNSIFYFDQSFKGVLNITNSIFTEQGHGFLFKENTSPIASVDIYVMGGSFAIYQIFKTENSPGIRAIFNCKYNASGDMMPIKTGAHKNTLVQTSDSEGEFASIHTSSINLEPLDSSTGAAAIRLSCSNYVPWSVGATGVGELKGSIHIDVSTAMVYMRTMEAIGSDQVSNWSVMFNGGV